MIDSISSKRYFEDSSVDLTTINSRSYAIYKAGTGKRILEIGTSSGGVSKILQEKGNIITGIEIDEEAAKIAGKYCSRMIVGNVEEMDFSKIFKDEKFEIIILTDVLEHLIWPEELLKRLHPLLEQSGFIIVSIPNFCHADVFLNLMRGDFHYTSTGLLDITHLRFFGLKNICELFKKSKYEIKDLNRIFLEKSEQFINDEPIPEDLYSLIKSIPDSYVHQYVFQAFPNQTPSDYPVPSYSLSQLSYEIKIWGEGREIQKLQQGLNLRNQELSQIKNRNHELENNLNELKSSYNLIKNRNHESDCQLSELEKLDQELTIKNKQLDRHCLELFINLYKLRNVPLFGTLNYLTMELLDKYKTIADIRLVRKSKFFNSDWYLQKNSDVAVSGVDPAGHYATYGWKEGRDPSPDFNTIKYLELYPDVKNSAINPLVHFEKYGKCEKRL